MPRNALRLSLITFPALLAACASTPEDPSASAEPQAAKVTPLQDAAPPPALRMNTQPFHADAPHTYTVKKGDTLWGLAQRFLNAPWMWPQIWYDNPQVQNPHRIYPGDVLTIVNIQGQPRLTKKLSPRIRILPAEQAIPTLPLEVLRPFLAYPQVVEAHELNSAPQVVGSPDGRLVLGRGDILYAHGGPMESGEMMAVVRPHKPLLDPDSKEVLGYEAEAAGIAQVLTGGETTTLRLIESPRETRKGDRIVPLPAPLTQDLRLTPAAADIRGHVISLPDTTTASTRWQVVAIDRGRVDGMVEGNVIRFYKPGRTTRVDTTPIPDPRGEDSAPDLFTDPVREVRLPDQVLGDAVVFLVYERASYALIGEVSEPIREGTCFSSPNAPAITCR
ncbi:MAG: LysM peptidoglycan-binding domain-containing protein [Gammaproteobacteria bacterium]|nr:LysM peptidoglycan-binding domain-containing protein [Gammaproteobacteria bacterium]